MAPSLLRACATNVKGHRRRVRGRRHQHCPAEGTYMTAPSQWALYHLPRFPGQVDNAFRQYYRYCHPVIPSLPSPIFRHQCTCTPQHHHQLFLAILSASQASRLALSTHPMLAPIPFPTLRPVIPSRLLRARLRRAPTPARQCRCSDPTTTTTTCPSRLQEFA
jgi:hypothetical protein